MTKYRSLLNRLTIALIILPSISFGFTLIEESNLVHGSIATLEQLKNIDLIVKKELKSTNSDKESTEIINKELKSYKLPIINVESSDLEIKIVEMNGFASSTPIGISVVDGKHRFCLPCSNGWNSFEFGIQKWEKPPRNQNGKYYKIINTTVEKQKYGVNGTVNSWNWPENRWAMFTIKTNQMEGVLLLYDDSAEFYSLILPEVGATIPTQHIIQTSKGSKISFQIRNFKKENIIEELRFEPNNITITNFSTISDKIVDDLLKSLTSSL